MTYNALDNIAAAKALRQQLILERDDINSGLSYDHATSWCDDCPRREPREPQSYSELYFPRPPAPSCCKENGSWEEGYEPTYKHLQQIANLIQSLTAYIGSEESEPVK